LWFANTSLTTPACGKSAGSSLSSRFGGRRDRLRARRRLIGAAEVDRLDPKPVSEARARLLERSRGSSASSRRHGASVPAVHSPLIERLRIAQHGVIVRVRVSSEDSLPIARLRQVKISATPHRVDDLLLFLRRMGYVAAEVEPGVISVERGSVTGVLDLKLALHLRIWNSVNETDARIVEADEPLQP
jgi:hypothetical protein